MKRIEWDNVPKIVKDCIKAKNDVWSNTDESEYCDYIEMECQEHLFHKQITITHHTRKSVKDYTYNNYDFVCYVR